MSRELDVFSMLFFSLIDTPGISCRKITEMTRKLCEPEIPSPNTKASRKLPKQNIRQPTGVHFGLTDVIFRQTGMTRRFALCQDPNHVSGQSDYGRPFGFE